MKTKIGLWIDHRKAIVVTVADQGTESKRILSDEEKQLCRSGDSPLHGPYESQQVPSDDSCQRAFTSHINHYYDEIIASLRETESMLVFGPDELKKRLAENHLSGHVVGIETADQMTAHQSAAKIKQHFAG